MQLKFFGGAQEVGRSSVLFRDSCSILLDCGIKLLEKVEFPIEIPEVDALILSHAHLDHCGAAPVLYKEMFIPTFGTQPTAELSELLLEDSLQVAKKEHMQPRFHKRQIKSLMNRYVPLDYGKTADFNNVEITLHDAGHISGSAIVAINRKGAKENKRVVYTGDYKIEPQLLHKGAEIVESDVLITESTYATREHPPREQIMEEIKQRIKATLDGGGSVVLPSFAVGRSQELLVMLYKQGFIDSTYVDGMAKTATRIALKHREFVHNWDALSSAASRAVFVESPADRDDAISSPSVIVTTAGMLKGGPVIDYITRLDARSEIIITGYQVEGSNGSSLLEKGIVKIGGRPIKVALKACQYDLSAHAGKKDLYEYVKRSGPSMVLCMHGDKDSATALAEGLKLEGYDARAPKVGESIKLE